MAVYVDDMRASFGRMKMCHMVADTEAELADMATRIGVDLKWWQYKGTYKSHFDICLSKRRLAVALGAKEGTMRGIKFGTDCRIKHEKPEDRPKPVRPPSRKA